jgi:pimeloyl-ACP methyl ester carboxylesterase
MNKWQKIRRWFLLSGLAGIGGLFVCAWVFGGMLVAPANRPVGAPPADFPAVSATLDSDSGSRIATWHLPVDGSRATIIVLHGIYENRRSMLGRAKLFRDAGYSVVLIDMQAHGESPGKNVTIGFLERHDVKAAVQFARTSHPDHRIGIVACSMGGAATLLASPLEIDALVLESVYPTITEAVTDRVTARVGPLSCVLSPLLLCQLQPRLGISASDLCPIDNVSQVGCPILVAAGDKDCHTTIAETRRMFDTAVTPKQLVIFEGAAHIDLLEHDRQKYQDEVLPFLEQYLRPEGERMKDE